MNTCINCGKNINPDSLFCPFCGEKILTAITSANDDKTEPISSNADALFVKKTISKKMFITIICVVAFVIVLISVIICEVKISKAESLYLQSEYLDAYSEIEYIPSLGREKLIRIKTSYHAGWYYEMYLGEKQRGMDDDDDYTDGFDWLTTGLHFALRDINSETKRLNSVERDEYQKFIDSYYSELSSTFNMSKNEANAFSEKMSNHDTSEWDKLKEEWLDDNFFTKNSDDYEWWK